MTQIRNDDLVNILLPDFQARYESNFAHKSACSLFQALPALRGFWPMSSVAYTNPQGIDLSVQGNDLTNNNSSLFGYDQLAPYVEFNGTTQYLAKVDGGAANWADIIGTEAYVESTQRGLTIGGWFNPDVTTNNQGLIFKGNNSVNDAYWLYTQAGPSVRFGIWNGGALTFIASTETYAISNWYFWVGRFVPSTSVDVYHNNVKTTNAVAVPASINDSAQNFSIGSFSGAATFYNGKTSMCFLCAAALSDAIIGTLYHQSRALYGV